MAEAIEPRPGSLLLFPVLLAVLLVAGCAGSVVAVAGLQPLDPPAVIGAAEVDSLQPTFRWQPFNPDEAFGEDAQETRERLRNVTYDLKIWAGNKGWPGPLVYQRRRWPRRDRPSQGSTFTKAAVPAAAPRKCSSKPSCPNRR